MHNKTDAAARKRIAIEFERARTPGMKMTNAEWWTVLNGLRIAAMRYHENANTCRALAAEYLEKGVGQGPALGLAEQFERQAAEAEAVADRLANEGWGE